MKTEVVAKHQIGEQMEKAAVEIMANKIQSAQQRFEQIYGLLCGAILLGCDEVIQPFYDKAKEEYIHNV